LPLALCINNNNKILSFNNKFHLSIDDVGSVLFEQYIDKQNTLSKFLLHTHEKYNCIWGLYFFTDWGSGSIFDFDISQLFDVRSVRVGCHAPEFAQKPFELSAEENRKWIKAFYDQIATYNLQTSKIVRFHYYSELFECIDVLCRNGVTGLFLTDRPAISYRLPEQIKVELKRQRYQRYKGIDLFRTDFRLEWLKEEKLNKNDLIELFQPFKFTNTPLVIYGHEYEYRDPEMYLFTELVLQVLVEDLGFTCMTP